jgi:hypothetical protein
MPLNPDPTRIRIRIRIHNSTLEDKFFQRLKNRQKSQVCTISVIQIKIKSTKKLLLFLHFLAPGSVSGSGLGIRIRIRIHNPVFYVAICKSFNLYRYRGSQTGKLKRFFVSCVQLHMFKNNPKNFKCIPEIIKHKQSL